jgi:predicted transcriptional regulator
MASTTVRITEKSRRQLRQLAKRLGKPMQAVLDEAVEEYRRKAFLDAVNRGYANLRADPEAWSEELAERKEWDATLMDGLDPNEGRGKSAVRPKRKRSRKG